MESYTHPVISLVLTFINIFTYPSTQFHNKNTSGGMASSFL